MPVSCRVLLVLLLLQAALPTARGDDATRRNLLDRAVTELRQAERLYHGSGGTRAAAPAARRALLLLDQADRLAPKDTRAPLLGVQAAVFAGDRKRATLWFERLAARSPYGNRDPHLHYARATIRLFLDRQAEAAIRSLDEMKALAPKIEPRGRDLLLYMALTRRAGSLMDLQEYARAIPPLARAARVAIALGDRTKEVTVRGTVGILLRLTGRANDSVTVFARLGQEDEKNAFWPWQQALGLLRMERYAAALLPLEEVTQRLEKHGAPRGRRAELRRAWLRLGTTHHALARAVQEDDEKRKELEAARRAFETYVGLEPDAAAGRYQLGRLLFEDYGRPYEAIGHLEHAHAKDPACEKSVRLLIRIAQQHGPPPEKDPDKALAAKRAWTAKRAAWEKELRENAERWAEERARRRARSPDGDDGCE